MSLILQSGKKAAAAAARHGASKNSSHLLRWLVSLGGLGLFLVAIVDSSVIPLPLPGSTDLLLLLLTAHRGTTPWSAVLLTSCAFAGSMVGGYLTWGVGRKGGQVALARSVPKRFLGRLVSGVERHGAWLIGVAAILPPPVPLTPFLLAAGALGVKRGPFLVFYGFGRALRYGLLGWLGLTFGRHFVRAWQSELNDWSTPILWAYGGLVLAGILYGLWKYLRSRGGRQASTIPAEDVA